MRSPHRIKCLLTGPGASGKSVAMRVMAIALRKNGFNVCVCEGGTVFEPFQKPEKSGEFQIVLDTELTY
jgi:adenylylsulfate kinase-like enzyme